MKPGARAAAARAPARPPFGLDVTSPQEIAPVIDQVVAEHGRLDILVNNAGINTLAHRVTLDEFPREEWDRILAVDLTGLYEVSKAAARVMRARGSGRIINIASIAGSRAVAASMRVRRRQGRRRQSDPRHGARARARTGSWSTASHRVPCSPRARGGCSTPRTARSMPTPSACSTTSRWAGPAPPKRSPWPCCSWQIPKTVTRTATSSPSTAAGRPATRAISDQRKRRLFHGDG